MDPRLQPLADVLVQVVVREILDAKNPTDQVGLRDFVPLYSAGQERDDVITIEKFPKYYNRSA